MGADKQASVGHLPEIFLAFKIEGELSLEPGQHGDLVQEDLSEFIVIPGYAEEGMNTAEPDDLLVQIRRAAA